MIRSKIKGPLPIPNAELQLNGEELISQAREDVKDLLVGDNGLKTKLDNLTYDKLQEMETAKAENIMKQMQMLPMPPAWSIKMG